MKWVRIGVIIFLMLLFGRPNVYAKESAVPIACQGQNTNICIYTIEDLNNNSKNIRKGFIKKGEQSKFITKHKKPGTYSYRIRQKSGTDPDMEYDKSSHIVDIRVSKKDGKIAEKTSIHKEGSKKEEKSIMFFNRPKQEEKKKIKIIEIAGCGIGIGCIITALLFYVIFRKKCE